MQDRFEMPIRFRQAVAGDVGDIADLMYSASPRLYDFIYLTPYSTAHDFIRHEFANGRGVCGHRNVTVAQAGDRVVATACFYSGADDLRLMVGTVANMFAFFGLVRVWPALLRANHTSSVMKSPSRREVYLANFGVHADFRGYGIGSRILTDGIDRARRAGYESMVLDVDQTNPGAEALYARHGFVVERVESFSGRRRDVVVPDSKRMVLRF